LTNEIELDNFVPYFEIKVHSRVSCSDGNEPGWAVKITKKFYCARVMSLAEGIRLIKTLCRIPRGLPWRVSLLTRPNFFLDNHDYFL